MSKIVGLRCGDCKLFGSLLSAPTKCSHGIPECTGAKGTYAEVCPVFTYPDGRQPLLDCEDEELPEWMRAEQLSIF